MEQRITEDFEPADAICQSIEGGRFDCDVTSRDDSGNVKCQGSLLVEPSGDSYVILERRGDFAGESGLLCGNVFG
jgi:hypothetical protein